MRKRAVVYLWTGNGAGKTTSALGIALRAIAHDFKVIIIQFMKGWGDKVGEYRIRKRLGKNYEIHQFGRTGWVDLKNPSEHDKILAEKGLDAAYVAAKKKPHLLILDEINLAVACKLLDEKDVLKFLDKIPAKVNVYMTGRYATPKLMRRANYVNEIILRKCPKKVEGKKG